MSWGTVEAEEEVTSWLATLSVKEFGHVRHYIDLLRFRLGRSRVRVTYYIAAGRRIVLLTVFGKSRQHEHAEIARASLVMRRCLESGHAWEEPE